MHALELHQARRPAADAVRAASRSTPRLAAPSPFAEPLHGQPAPALASAARRVGHLRGLPPGPHLPAAARVQPAGGDHRSGATRPRCRRATGTSRCSTTAFPSLEPAAHDAAAELIVPTAPGAGRCEVVVFTQDPQRRRSARCRSTTSSCCCRSGATARDALGARARHPVRAAVREPRRRGRRHAAPSARADLRLPGRAAGAGAHAATQRRAHLRAARRGLLQDTDRGRDVAAASACSTQGEHAVAFVPVCARYPYEVWVAPIEPVAGLRASSTDDAARRPGARAEDRAAQVRRPVAAAVALPDGLVPGADRRPAASGVRTCTPSSIRPTARADRLKYLAGTEIARRASSRWTRCPRTRRASCRQVDGRRSTMTTLRSVFGAAGGRGRRAGPGQPARRAHRLQRRLRAADGDSAAHARWRCGAATASRLHAACGRARTSRCASRSDAAAGGALRQLRVRLPGRGAQRAASRSRRSTSHVASDVPMGVGLSSSAALEVAHAARLARAAGSCPRRRRDRAAGAARGDRVRRRALRHHGPDGVEPGRHRPARCSSTRARCERRRVALPAGSAVLVLDSGVARSLADSGYNQRRGECEAAARLLGVGVAARRRPTSTQLEGLPELLRRRARHVVHARTRACSRRCLR